MSEIATFMPSLFTKGEYLRIIDFEIECQDLGKV